ncbi:sulfotransferase [Akkermansiaceae bacterium]|nr:sulfotransferase [Akkermansiaceae bacterium]
MDNNRVNEFVRDESFDGLLREFNGVIENVKLEGLCSSECLSRSPLFIVGLPRSGTTLLTQVLAETNGFSYPSNLIARFYMNPALGERVTKLLAPLLRANISGFESNIGRTKEWNEPSEFGFFWSRFFDFTEHHAIQAESVTEEIRQSFVSELNQWESESGKPVLLKAMIMNYSLEILYEMYPNALFIRTDRSYHDVVQSIIKSRRLVTGADNNWFSCRPKNWRELNEIDDPVEKTVAQIKSIESSLDSFWEHLPSKNKEICNYGEFCSKPKLWVQQLGKKIGLNLNWGDLPDEFIPNDSQSFDEGILEALKAYGLISHE